MKLCFQNDKYKLPVSGSGGTEPQIWRPGLESLNIEQLHSISCSNQMYLTITPRSRMGSESIAHEAEGRMGYWLRGHDGERNNCFSTIQLVGKKYRDKTT